MKPADQIVEALLGDEEDPKDFIVRQDDMAKSILLDKLREQHVDPAIVDGVECFGMREDANGDQYRVDAGDQPATFWTVTIHTTDPNNWMVDYDDYNTPESARDAAVDVRSILLSMFPDHEIHLVDDIV